MANSDFEAVVVGSGPNGLSAAITLQKAGLSVLLIEAKETLGGGMRSDALTLPGFVHDVCSAIHPLGAVSPFFNSLPLESFGLQWIQPRIEAAHPFDDGNAAALYRSVEQTALTLQSDQPAYRKLLEPLVRDWPRLKTDILGPLHIPAHPVTLVRFGWHALPSALKTGRRFSTKKAKGLWAGMAAHSMLPLNHAITSAIALTLLTAGHTGGWPFPKGGTKTLTDALVSCFLSMGGKVETGFHVKSLSQLPSSHLVLFDVTPRQLLQIAGPAFSFSYRRQLQRYRYGMGVFKIDWALNGSIPFIARECREAGTVHLGNTLEEIASSEQQVWEGKHPEKPFVLLAQQSLFDPGRAPEGKQTAWAYCHVPHGSPADMTASIEKQVERFAPGFRDLILERHTMNANKMEEYNPNYIGGDINGGILDWKQLFTRPALRFSPYKTSTKGIYICSSSTPPGGGVHGMCGYHAAKKALHDIFHL